MGQKRVLVKQIVQKFLDELIDELTRGNRLEFRDFGVFETKRRKSRTAQNPRTLERVSVPIKWTVKFKVGRLMKAKVQAAIDAQVDSDGPSSSNLRLAADSQPDTGPTTAN
jgi:nucleoid DNA-binding protein